MFFRRKKNAAAPSNVPSVKGASVSTTPAMVFLNGVLQSPGAKNDYVLVRAGEDFEISWNRPGFPHKGDIVTVVFPLWQINTMHY